MWRVLRHQTAFHLLKINVLPRFYLPACPPPSLAHLVIAVPINQYLWQENDFLCEGRTHLPVPIWRRPFSKKGYFIILNGTEFWCRLYNIIGAKGKSALIVVVAIHSAVSDRWRVITWGEILRSPENSVPQTIVFLYQEIGDILWGKHRKKSYAPV
jgi:hypothetical protein